jgi:hypothetical protein
VAVRVLGTGTGKEKEKKKGGGMEAKKAVRLFGKALVGLAVRTEHFGAYPGGIVEVVELYPDPSAKEIVMHVRRDIWDEGIGIFADENIEIV